MGKVRIHDGVALPEQHAIVIRSSAGADVLFGPAVLPIEGIRAVRSAGVLEAQGVDCEGFAFALIY